MRIGILYFVLLALLVSCKSIGKSGAVSNFRRLTANGYIGTWMVHGKYGWSFSSDSIFYEFHIDEHGNKIQEEYGDIRYPEPMRFKVAHDTLMIPDFDSIQFKILSIGKRELILKEISTRRIHFAKDTIVVFNKSKEKYDY